MFLKPTTENLSRQITTRKNEQRNKQALHKIENADCQKYEKMLNFTCTEGNSNQMGV